MAPETLLEEYTTPKGGDGLDDDSDSSSSQDDEMEASTSSSTSSDDDTAVEETTITNSGGEERSDLGSISLTSPTTVETPTDASTNSGSSTATPDPVKEGVATEDAKTVKKAAPSVEMDFYDFNEPFLWFLHAINEVLLRL